MPRIRHTTTALACALILAAAGALFSACMLAVDGEAKVIGGPASAEEPARVAIPSLGVNSPLIRLKRGELPPREKGTTAGWYAAGARPGEPGAAVIIGHDAPGEDRPVFRDLHRLAAGSTIDVERGDGTVLHFTVTRTEKAGGDAFPAREAYAPTKERALRLVTCADGRGAEHLVVHATLTPAPR
ncbi:sortase [Streptomyces sp. NPDC049577]|uniref:sortase domain-containing protein n=1 Tax=Streptomyces sp. NPDC049577 TaxID=3155153 RepID=UPI003445FB13